MPTLAYFVVVAFALLGAGLKYIDCAFDSDLFDKNHAKIAAIGLVVLWVAVSVLDQLAALVLMSVLIAVYLTGKVDNQAFLSGAFLVLLSLFLLHIEIPYLYYDYLVLLTLAGVVDEKLNDSLQGAKGIVRVLEHRLVLKASVLALCAFSAIPFLYLIAFLAFDLSYEAVWGIEQKKARTLNTFLYS